MKFASEALARHNPLVNRTRNGIAPRSAQVYGSLRGAMPLRAGYRERSRVAEDEKNEALAMLRRMNFDNRFVINAV